MWYCHPGGQYLFLLQCERGYRSVLSESATAFTPPVIYQFIALFFQNPFSPQKTDTISSSTPFWPFARIFLKLCTLWEKGHKPSKIKAKVILR